MPEPLRVLREAQRRRPEMMPLGTLNRGVERAVRESFEPGAETKGRPDAFDQLNKKRLSLSLAVPQASAVDRRPVFAANPARVGVLALSGQGGSGNVARVAADALARGGNTVRLLTAPGGFWESLGNDPRFEVSHVSAPTTPREPSPEWVKPLAKQLAKEARTHDLDTLWVHYAAGLLDAAIQAKKTLAAEGKSFKVIATLHGTDVTTWGQKPEHAKALKEQLEQADGVTAVSEWLADEAVRLLDLKKRPEVIPNSIGTDVFHPNRWYMSGSNVGNGADIRRAIAPRGEFVFAHASNFRSVKRPLDLLEVFAEVRKAGVPAKLLLLGDSSPEHNPEMQTFYERAVEHGVAEDIYPVGPVSPEQLARYYAAADLTLVTSESESFCLAALESMAVGTPVLSTRSGGPREVLFGVSPDAHGESRNLSDVGDAHGMAQRALELIRNPKEYREAQLQSVKVPTQRFPLGRQQAQYVELMDRLNAPSEPPAGP